MEKLTSRIASRLRSHIAVIDTIKENGEIGNIIESVVEAVRNAFAEDRKILFCGNGGSAADAQHLAAELSGRFYFDRPPLDAEALHANTSYLTAVANDYSFDEVFARLVKAKGRQGDVLIGLSTSGNSRNVLRAFQEARLRKMITVGFTGRDGGAMKPLSDYLIAVPSSDTPRIQEAHIVIGHIVCELVESSMFAAPEC